MSRTEEIEKKRVMKVKAKEQKKNSVLRLKAFLTFCF